MTESSSRCLHCGAALLPGARFCPECGRPTTAKSGNSLPWIIGALLGLALILLLVVLLLRPKAPSIVAAPVAVPKGPPIVAAPTRIPSGPPVVAAPPPAAVPKAPEDPNRAAVAAYLKQMAAIEAQRKTIVNGLLPGLITLAMLQKMGGMEDMLQQLDENNEGDQKPPEQPPSQQQAQSTIDGYRRQLSGIIASAQRVQPPLPAAGFHNSYLYAVRSYDAAIAQVETALVQKDATIGTKMGNLSGGVTQPLAGSDAELQKLLDRYQLPRTFKVDDKLEGSLTGAELSP